ncbi:MAG: hypothetical protein SPL13_02480 [Clostridia bacterium]|nr:hypothetical protein [Clostridia bacterium]
MEEKKKKSILTLIIVDAILLLLVLMYIFDMIRASTFSLQLGYSEGDHTFTEWLADGNPGEIYVQLKDGSGKPVVGHSVYALVEAGDGQFESNRAITDEEGKLTFVFTVPEKKQAIWEYTAQKSEIRIYDEDNSVFFLVPKTRHLTISYKPIAD